MIFEITVVVLMVLILFALGTAIGDLKYIQKIIEREASVTRETAALRDRLKDMPAEIEE